MVLPLDDMWAECDLERMVETPKRKVTEQQITAKASGLICSCPIVLETSSNKGSALTLLVSLTSHKS